LITHQKLGAQLYDRASDPEEAHDLAQTPEGKAVIANLLLERETRGKQTKIAGPPTTLRSGRDDNN
jgi:hypothetical protein